MRRLTVVGPRDEVPSFSSQAGVPAVSGTVAYPYEIGDVTIVRVLFTNK